MCIGNVEKLPSNSSQARLDITIYTPGTVKSGKSGQLPTSAGSPPMRTHVAFEGVGPSRINNMNHPGGLAFAFGGAVIVQVFPAQENSGKIVL
jgi:hypothetical protein